MTETLDDIAKRLEFHETAVWAAQAILRHELLTPVVVDPCAGYRVLGNAAREYDCTVIEYDVYPWSDAYQVRDFLTDNKPGSLWSEVTIFMNPPFSRSVEFIEKCFELNVRKIICFQRLSWTESNDRREFWNRYPPNRKYVCGDRAVSWRGTIPVEKRNVPVSKGGAGVAGPTAFGWYVWERGHPPGTLEGRIYRNG